LFGRFKGASTSETTMQEVQPVSAKYCYLQIYCAGA
jgi:hypothetical protein